MIDFDKDYVLENDQVLLRPLQEADYDSLLEFAEKEPQIWQFNAFGADGRQNLRRYLATALANRARQTDYVFAVVDKRENRVVGSTRYYLINQQTKTLELGFTWYGLRYQGTYINKNAKYLLLELAFDRLGYERVGFKANVDNHRSIRAMLSIGCQEEGVLRSYSLDAVGNRIDMVVLSILREEWLTTIKSALRRKIGI